MLKGLIGLTALATAANAATVELWHNMTYAVLNPDGLAEKNVATSNGTWPPPMLRATMGDTVYVHANNNFGTPSSIHHHGLFFPQTSYYDGAPGVTQCGIPNGSTLDYEIITANQSGTYWYHSHTAAHYVDGFRAPFIIDNPNEPYTYDDDYTIVVQDWYHAKHSTLESQFMNIYNPTGAEPVPDYALIYGVFKNGTHMEGYNENLSIPFEAGKTYRLRLINTGAFAMFYLWLDGHNMTVIEVDGTDTEEYPIDVVSLTVAQRVSVLVTAKNTTDTNYNFHATFDWTMFDSYSDDLKLNYTSVIDYGAADALADEEIKDEFTPMDDYSLVPLEVVAEYQANKYLELGVWFDTFDDGFNHAAFNNISYVFPKVPSIISQLTMGNDSNNVEIYGKHTHAQVLEYGDVIDVMVINWDANGHPFHLHGHKFQIVRIAQDVASNDTTLNPPHLNNLTNPMRRDTIFDPAGGAVNLRFVADNPGTWIFHCHIEWHLDAGLAVVFIEAPNESQQQLKMPQQLLDHCEALNIATSGNAAGRNSTTNLSGQSKGANPIKMGWTPKAKGALAGCVITAVLGMITVTWYAFGGQLDAEEMDEQVKAGLAAKEARNQKLKFWKK